MAPSKTNVAALAAALMILGCTTPNTKVALNLKVVDLDAATLLPASKKTIIRPAPNDVAHCADPNPYYNSVRGICGTVYKVESITYPEKKLEGLGMNDTTLIAIVPPGLYKVTLVCTQRAFPATYRNFFVIQIDAVAGKEYLPYCVSGQEYNMVVRPITQEWRLEEVRATSNACLRDKCEYIYEK